MIASFTCINTQLDHGSPNLILAFMQTCANKHFWTCHTLKHIRQLLIFMNVIFVVWQRWTKRLAELHLNLILCKKDVITQSVLLSKLSACMNFIWYKPGVILMCWSAAACMSSVMAELACNACLCCLRLGLKGQSQRVCDK